MALIKTVRKVDNYRNYSTPQNVTSYWKGGLYNIYIGSEEEAKLLEFTNFNENPSSQCLKEPVNGANCAGSNTNSSSYFAKEGSVYTHTNCFGDCAEPNNTNTVQLFSCENVSNPFPTFTTCCRVNKADENDTNYISSKGCGNPVQIKKAQHRCRGLHHAVYNPKAMAMSYSPAITTEKSEASDSSNNDISDSTPSDDDNGKDIEFKYVFDEEIPPPSALWQFPDNPEAIFSVDGSYKCQVMEWRKIQPHMKVLTS